MKFSSQNLVERTNFEIYRSLKFPRQESPILVRKRGKTQEIIGPTIILKLPL